MKVPFSRELDEVFRSDRSVWLKILGCGFVSAFLVVGVAIRSDLQVRGKPLATSTLITLGVLAAVAGCFLGLILSLRDTITRRTQEGRPVSRLARLYFVGGVECVFIWAFTLLFLAGLVTFCVTMFRS